MLMERDEQLLDRAGRDAVLPREAAPIREHELRRVDPGRREGDFTAAAPPANVPPFPVAKPTCLNSISARVFRLSFSIAGRMRASGVP